MEIVIASVFGLIIGSFLNVVIHRLPKSILVDQTDSLSCLMWPSSTAPCCGARLEWYENIPVFSWLFLKGRCGHCGASIAPRYILVEVLTALCFAGSSWQFGLTPTGVAYALFMALLISLFFIDLETYLLPDKLTLPLLWFGLGASTLGLTPVAPADAIWGACLGFTLPWSVNQLYKLKRKHDGFGGGDFKLLAALGAWTGWLQIVPILCVASILGLFTIVLLTAFKRQQLTLNKAFPFGPFLIASGVGVVLFGF